MAGTRTVHRGSRGRFAGASGGKAEKVRVGRGYSRSPATGQGGQKVSHPKGLVNRSKTRRTLYAAGQGAKFGAKKAGKTALIAGVGIGVSIGSAKVINRVVLGPKPVKPTTYSGQGVGRRERVSMPHSPLVRDAQVGGRSVKSGAFVGVKPRKEHVTMAAGGRRRTDHYIAGVKVGPNYKSAVGKKEYVGRRLKPGESRGFKLSGS